MSTLDFNDLAENAEFKERVELNLVFTAHQIVGESSSTPNTEIRQKYGNKVLNNPGAFVERFAKSLVSLPNIHNNIHLASPDTDPLTYDGSASIDGEFDEIDVEIRNNISAVYNDSYGNRLCDYVDSTILVSPLESIEFVVEGRENIGGAGANFIIVHRHTRFIR